MSKWNGKIFNMKESSTDAGRRRQGALKYPFMFVCLLIMTSMSLAQNIPGDDTVSKDWPSACTEVEIPSSLDSEMQPAYFLGSKGDAVRPLIVSLHSWSAGYEQKDSLSWFSIGENLNYIHPHFRGPNNNPMACGSRAVIQDIDDAIGYAIAHGHVDTTEIHVIGGSGGGYATLLAYMKSRYAIKSFSAWVPITNLVDWYYESVGRDQKYANDIAMATQAGGTDVSNPSINEAEARRRSPVFMSTPTTLRQQSMLRIYTGIHDGYTGSVPISQSLKFYNKVVRDFAPNNKTATVSIGEILGLVERRNSRFTELDDVKKGALHFQRSFEDKVQVTVFEGGHEMLLDRAMADFAF